MTREIQNPFDGIKCVFHEPSRLSVCSFLSGAPAGLTFTELKERSGLTDGNLSRHLKTLEQEGVVEIDKAFVGARPCTTVKFTKKGRKAFVEYLAALEGALEAAILQAGRRRKPQGHGAGESLLGKLFPKPV